MAAGDEPVKRPAILAGQIALVWLALLTGGALLGLVLEGLGGGMDPLAAIRDPHLARVAWFTVWQAVLSTVMSVVPALAVARAFSRHRAFPGRALLLRLFAVPLALPAIVAALGVLSLYGRSGLLAEPLSRLTGASWPGIYGLGGILVAHVFFNLPLATRLFLEALDAVPGNSWRLASQLGMGPWAQWRWIEWPAMRAALPGISGLVLMLCATSFTIVLTLGGGPGATTLEVAIYQALRFDFDPGRAVVLTLLQLALTLCLVIAIARLGGNFTGAGDPSLAPRRPVPVTGPGSIADFLLILFAGLFVCGPILAVILSGLGADLARLASDPAVRRAAGTSVTLALGAAAMATVLSLALIRMRKFLELARRGAQPSLLERLAEIGPLALLAVPPVVVGAGWFILLRHLGDVFAFAPVMVILVNAAMAMPFVLRAIRPAHDHSVDLHDRLARSLGVTGFNRWRLVDWPVLRAPLLTGFAFAMALSLGDLGVIALFGSDAVQTLPYLLLQRLGSYRTEDAAGLALLLAMLTLALTFISSRRTEPKR